MASIKSYLSKLFAAHIARKIKGWSSRPIDTQNRVFKALIKSASNTQFGKDHNFSQIQDYKTFVQNVPVRDYEALKPYVEKAVSGESNVLWEGKPLYFAKTSGTTSGAKHIPITAVSIKAQVEASRNAMLMIFMRPEKQGF